VKFAEPFSSLPLSLPNTPSVEKIATDILKEVMKFRRMAHKGCADSPCPDCLAPHLPKVIRAIEQNRPIVFVLPAFPGKSPNLAKVLGPLPDLAERHSLEFLEKLCQRIRRHHLPGARIILCSDGRVFSDVVGMREEHVSAYQLELARIIEDFSLTSLSLFNLDDLFEGQSFDEMRGHLMVRHGKSIDELKNMVRLGLDPQEGQENQEAHRLYCGITRFLFEDAMTPGQTKSKSSIQKDARVRSYQVIQRSSAWSELLFHQFPDAVRLSIHSQICGAKKLGIRLMEAENLMTPWHGVAVEIGGRIDFVKRSQAEALGARIVQVNGRPSHYEIAPDNKLGLIC
jgi:pyoverdine/dityrosine biosynthesis protein Dit1